MSDAKSNTNCVQSEVDRTPDGVKKHLYALGHLNELPMALIFHHNAAYHGAPTGGQVQLSVRT